MEPVSQFPISVIAIYSVYLFGVSSQVENGAKNRQQHLRYGGRKRN